MAYLLMLLALLSMSAMAVRIQDTESDFTAFAERYGRRYANPEERAHRFAIFQRSMRRAAALARANPLADFGPSPFADLTAEEWTERLGQHRPVPSTPKRVTDPLRVSPAALDWRTKGVVGPIKNQGQCGSCWAFSTIANIESQWALAGNKFVSLSEEQIVACDTLDTGCNGGDTLMAMQWIIYYNDGGVAAESAYPYNPNDKKCRATPPAARIEGYVNIDRDENAMAQWCGDHGPVSICIDANSLQLYMGGILTTCPSKSINHCVAIVGYNTTNSPPYWIVRNSWGTGWGERGYFRLAIGHNLCGITSEPTSALIHRPPPQRNVTFSTCSDSACDSCKSLMMEEGQCSDGGLEGSMVAVCDGSTVKVTEFNQQGCDAKSREYTATVGACNAHGKKFFKVTCQG